MESVVYFLPTGEETDFHTKFRERYNKEPNIIHIDSYDATMLLIEALRKCNDASHERMPEYVTNVKEYPGAGGLLTFDKESWSFEKPFMLKTVKNGKFVELQERRN